MSIKELIEEEIKEELDLISALQPGTTEYGNSINGLSTLITKRNEIVKLELDETKNEIQKELELKKLEMEIDKLKAERTNRRVTNILTAAGIVIPVATTIWANVYNWQKEQNGIMTSTGGKNAINALTKIFKH